MEIRDFDPKSGQAFQGDVAIVALPAGLKFSTADEFKPVNGNLVVQEGELTGHHHHIPVARNFHQQAQVAGDPVMNFRDTRLAKALGGKAKKIAEGIARMFRDQSVADQLVRAKVLTRTDLMIGVLSVEGAPVTLKHQEHDAIRIPVGSYYVGRQVESAGAEERVVRD
jgi:hypothetical protein